MRLVVIKICSHEHELKPLLWSKSHSPERILHLRIFRSRFISENDQNIAEANHVEYDLLWGSPQYFFSTKIHVYSFSYEIHNKYKKKWKFAWKSEKFTQISLACENFVPIKYLLYYSEMWKHDQVGNPPTTENDVIIRQQDSCHVTEERKLSLLSSLDDWKSVEEIRLLGCQLRGMGDEFNKPTYRNTHGATPV